MKLSTKHNKPRNDKLVDECQTKVKVSDVCDWRKDVNDLHQLKQQHQKQQRKSTKLNYKKQKEKDPVLI